MQASGIGPVSNPTRLQCWASQSRRSPHVHGTPTPQFPVPLGAGSPTPRTVRSLMLSPSKDRSRLKKILIEITILNIYFSNLWKKIG